jgi:hypothetical protein
MRSPMALAGTFPAADDAPLARALLALLARGEPVTESQLAAETNRPAREVAATLTNWPNVDRDGHAAVVAFSGLRVSFPPLARTSTADIVDSFCCHVHFLAGRDTAQRWLDQHPGGRVLDLYDAYEVGQRATAALRSGAAAAR